MSATAKCDKSCPAWLICFRPCAENDPCGYPEMRSLALREKRLAEAVDEALPILISGLAHPTGCPCHVCEGIRVLKAAKAGEGA